MIKVPLNLYTDRAVDILKGVSYRILNTERGVSSCTWIEYVTKFEREPNGQVVIVIDDNTWQFRRSSWRTRRDAKSIKQFFRGQFMNAIQTAIGYTFAACRAAAGWKNYDEAYAYLWSTKCNDYDIYSTNCFKPDRCGNATYGELKAIFYALGEIKQLKTKCTNDQLENVIGQPRDPFQTEMERLRREELANLEFDYNCKVNATYSEQDAEIRKITAEIKDKYTTKRDELYHEYNEKRASIIDMCNNMVRAA